MIKRYFSIDDAIEKIEALNERLKTNELPKILNPLVIGNNNF